MKYPNDTPTLLEDVRRKSFFEPCIICELQ